MCLRSYISVISTLCVLFMEHVCFSSLTAHVNIDDKTTCNVYLCECVFSGANEKNVIFQFSR